MGEFRSSEGIDPSDPAPVFDPEAKADLLDQSARLGVGIKETLSVITGPSMLKVVTGSGTILLEKEEEGPRFHVNSSEDDSMQQGDVVVLDGASISGVDLRPGLLAPNARLAFRRLQVMEMEVGEHDSSHTITKETIGALKATNPRLIQELPGGKVIFSVFNRSQQATDFVARAEVIALEENGPISKSLF